MAFSPEQARLRTLQQALSSLGTFKEEINTLEIEFWERLRASGLTIDVDGSITLTGSHTIPVTIEDDTIVNAQINSAAAIAYSKLDLADSIVNADIAAAAAIAWSKLSKTGSSLADLATRSAADLSSGTLPDARFPATLPAISGANLTNLDASDLASGTVPDARFPATLPAVSGANLTNLDASDLASGAVPVARLSNGTQTVVSSTTTSNQNDWAPGLSGDTVIFWSGASDITITGFAGGVSGQRIVFKNTGSNIATFSHNSGSSSAGNKLFNLATSAGTPVAAGGYIVYQYDGTQWRIVAHEQGAWITPAFNAADYTASSGNWTVDSADITALAYILRGNSLTIAYNVNNTDVSATPLTLSRVIPGGFTSAKEIVSINMNIDAGGTRAAGQSFVQAASTSLSFRKMSGNWSTTASDNTSVQGVLLFDVS